MVYGVVGVLYFGRVAARRCGDGLEIGRAAMAEVEFLEGSQGLSYRGRGRKRRGWGGQAGAGRHADGRLPDRHDFRDIHVRRQL